MIWQIISATVCRVMRTSNERGRVDERGRGAKQPGSWWLVALVTPRHALSSPIMHQLRAQPSPMMADAASQATPLSSLGRGQGGEVLLDEYFIPL